MIKGVSFIAAAVLCCAFAVSARGGVYEVRACGPSANSAAFTQTVLIPPSLNVTNQCPPIAGQRLTGLTVASSSANTPRGASASWTIAAPSGTTLRRLDVQRAFQKWDPDWSVGARTAEQAVLDTCEIRGAQVSCGKGLDAGSQATAYVDLDTSRVSFTVECLATHTCSGWTTPVQAWIAIYSATATVNDPVPPRVNAPVGPLLAPGWHRGSEQVDLDATDASGVKVLTLSAGPITLFERRQSCDYSRMQPCPSAAHESVTVDTSKLSDGTHTLKVTATDAADQPGTSDETLRVDRHAPGQPMNLRAERNPDGTLAFSWTNPDQGAAAPIVGAHFAICARTGQACVTGGSVTGPSIEKLASVEVPGEEHLVKIWLRDEAGNVDEANAASLTVDPRAITAPRAIDTNPPLLAPGPRPSSGLRITKASRSGSTLTLSGTIARAATARVAAAVSMRKTTKTLASARATPKKGKWSLKVRLTSALRDARTFYVRVTYPGQTSFAKSTLRRKLSKKSPGRGSTAEEFSLETR
jgi:hypothetical protein